MEEYDRLLKLIIIGESGVGKSALLLRYCEGVYNTNYISTIGVDFKIKTIEIGEKKVKLQIWDTAGQERFRTIINSYYRGTNAIMLVFDLTNPYSFGKLKFWMEEITKHTTSNNHKIILVGNKCERENMIRVNESDINEFIANYNIEYVPVSAKFNINIEEAFTRLIKSFIDSTIITNNASRMQIKQGGKINNNKCC